MDSEENALVLQPAVALAIFIGLGVIVFFLLLKWITQEQSDKGRANNEKPEKSKSSSADASGKHGKKEQTGTVKVSKKKLTERESRRTARAHEKGFNHPWLLANLKGHSGRVLDMDFSANGKFLVSCGDVVPDWQTSRCSLDMASLYGENKENLQPSSSEREFDVESSSSSSMCSDSGKETSESSSCSKGLSRRQKKNRKDKNEKKKQTTKSNKASRETARLPPYLDDTPPIEMFVRMSMNVDECVRIIKSNYIVPTSTMSHMGFPINPLWYHENKSGQAHPHNTSTTEVSKNPSWSARTHSSGQVYYVPKQFNSVAMDVNAREFVPRDSGNGTSSTSSDDGSTEEEERARKKFGKNAHAKICSRCGQVFYTTHLKYLSTDECSYHPGKVRTHNGNYGPMWYTCCEQDQFSSGCITASLHVWNGPKDSLATHGYVETRRCPFYLKSGNYGIYGLDCEMSYTVKGLEVVKVTVVDLSGRPVYHQYVKPDTKIIDFNTRFSGVDKDDYYNQPLKTLVEVQRDLTQMIWDETVLVGHGLENDLKGLKLRHKTVVDTAFTFPHHNGLPWRRSLKHIMAECLKKEIQVSAESGHDSLEDSRSCVELLLYRIKQDYSSNF